MPPQRLSTAQLEVETPQIDISQLELDISELETEESETPWWAKILSPFPKSKEDVGGILRGAFTPLLSQADVSVTDPISSQLFGGLYNRYAQPLSSPGALATSLGAGALIKGGMAAFPRIAKPLIGGAMAGTGVYGASQLPGSVKEFINMPSVEGGLDVAEHLAMVAGLGIGGKMMIPQKLPPKVPLQLHAGQPVKQLPAIGETTPVTHDPRFYGTSRGVADVENISEIERLVPGPSSAQNTRGVVDPVFDDPVLGALVPPRTAGQVPRERLPLQRTPPPATLLHSPTQNLPDIDPITTERIVSQYPTDIAKGKSVREILKQEGKTKIKWGQKISTQELRAITGDLPKLDRKQDTLGAELINIPRAIMATDITPVSSALFRQALPMIHNAAWRGSIDDMVKAYGSEETFRMIMSSITNRPLYNLGKRAGLKLTDLYDLNNREEAIASTILERVPGVGRAVRASNRSYTATLDKIRADAFDNLITYVSQGNQSFLNRMLAGQRGRNLFEKSMEAPSNLFRQALYASKKVNILDKEVDLTLKWLDPTRNRNLAENIADYVNTATGRGSLGKLEKNAKELSTALFSPRRLAAIVKSMDPRNYIFADPFIRRQYWKSLISYTAAWQTFGTLGTLRGGEFDLNNTTNPDFGKIRIGNTRIDPGAGFLQQLVYLNRMFRGERTSSVTGKTEELGTTYRGPTYASTTLDYIANKANPVIGYIWDMATEAPNKPFDPGQRALELFLPMAIGDLLETYREVPSTLWPEPVAATLLGMGVQTYEAPHMGSRQQIGTRRPQ